MSFNTGGFNTTGFNTSDQSNGIPVVLATNTFQQLCKVHCENCPCVGEYYDEIQTPGQTGLKVNGVPVVLSGVVHTYGCSACSSDREIVNASKVLKVNGVPVALMGPVSGLHKNYNLAGTICGLKA